LACLSGPVRDEDVLVRGPAEACCEALGAACAASLAAADADAPLSQAAAAAWLPLDLLLPRVAGSVAGGDTFSQRTAALRLLTHVYLGLCKGDSAGAGAGAAPRAVTLPVAVAVAGSLADHKLYEFREPALREAALLLARAVVDNTVAAPAAAASSSSGSSSGRSSNGSGVDGQLMRLVVTALVFLQARCPGEEDVVPVAAQRDMHKLASLVAGTGAGAEAVDAVAGAHFVAVLNLITTTSLAATATSTDTQDLYQWRPQDVLKVPPPPHLFSMSPPTHHLSHPSHAALAHTRHGRRLSTCSCASAPRRRGPTTPACWTSSCPR